MITILNQHKTFTTERYFDTRGHIQPLFPQQGERIPEQLLKQELTVVSAVAPMPIADDELVPAVMGLHHSLVMQGVTIVKRPEDLQKKGLKVILALEHPPQNMETLEKVFEHGIRVCSLTSPARSLYGSNFASHGSGLGPQGIDFIAEVARLGIILDLALAGTTSAEEALTKIRSLQHTGQPAHVMISHTACMSEFPHPRNTTDAVIKDVWKLQGIVGLTTSPGYLHHKCNTLTGEKKIGYVCPLADHLRRLGELDSMASQTQVVFGTEGHYRTYSTKQQFHTAEREKMVGKLPEYMAVREPKQIRTSDGPDRSDFLERFLGKIYSNNRYKISNLLGANAHRFFNRALNKEQVLSTRATAVA